MSLSNVVVIACVTEEKTCNYKFTDTPDMLSVNACKQKIARRVGEILELLSRSDFGMECSDVFWLQKLLKSVIRALDDIRCAQCMPHNKVKTNIPNYVIIALKICANTASPYSLYFRKKN